MNKRVHIIGVSGKATSGIAKMFIDLGWSVSGSDQGVYPPVSTYLEKIGVSILTPYAAENINNELDLVVVGGNALIIDKENPEVGRARELNLRIVSYPEVLENFLIKPSSIVVVGNYGKGTISGAITKALTDLGCDPSYMVGGEMFDLPESLKLGSLNWSVVEGDEYPTPPLDGTTPKSKFFYYKPKYLVITSAEWDHFDQFPTEQAYIDNYIELVKKLPSDGLVVAHYEGEHVREIIKAASCKVVTYSLINEHATVQGEKLGLTPELAGRMNLANLTAAYALLTQCGFDHQKVLNSLNTYKGINQRMTVLHEHSDLVLVRDYAHSPIKAKAAIATAKEMWPDHKIVAVFDIFASSLKNKAILPRLAGMLDAADLVLIPKVTLPANQDRSSLVTGKEITNEIAKTQPQVAYVPDQAELLEKIVSYPNPKTILLMSSGGMGGLEKLVHERISC